MDKLITDSTERSNADKQLVSFKNKDGFLELQQSKDTIFKLSPIEWWIHFGDFLGLLCSSSGYECNWSTYNQVHTKKKNHMTTLKIKMILYEDDSNEGPLSDDSIDDF
ncbi:hypothetical protein M5K25_024103 [Dendrobium thyrsiflorum]|uniref:Uncharacterized protein n=1 Tax=Dendrobium thyrsiflorum TaxID=117978 RepID=A0ABD0U1F8_DENTH